MGDRGRGHFAPEPASRTRPRRICPTVLSRLPPGAHAPGGNRCVGLTLDKERHLCLWTGLVASPGNRFSFSFSATCRAVPKVRYSITGSGPGESLTTGDEPGGEFMSKVGGRFDSLAHFLASFAGHRKFKPDRCPQTMTTFGR